MCLAWVEVILTAGSCFCSKAEFILYKLREMGKIEQKDIMQICEQFDILDDTQHGKLTLADLMDSD